MEGNLLKRLTVVFIAGACMLLAVGAANAGPANPKATGSIVMGAGAQNDPKQAIDFNAFANPMKGNVTTRTSSSPTLVPESGFHPARSTSASVSTPTLRSSRRTASW